MLFVLSATATEKAYRKAKEEHLSAQEHLDKVTSILTVEQLTEYSRLERQAQHFRSSGDRQLEKLAMDAYNVKEHKSLFPLTVIVGHHG